MDSGLPGGWYDLRISLVDSATTRGGRVFTYQVHHELFPAEVRTISPLAQRHVYVQRDPNFHEADRLKKGTGP